MSNTLNATINENLLKNLLKEIRILNAQNGHTRVYLTKEYAEAIKITPQTLRIYLMRSRKGDKLYDKYLPHGSNAGGRYFCTQQQVNDYWGVV